MLTPLWVKKKFRKKDLDEVLVKHTVVTITDTRVATCTQGFSADGVYKGNGVVQTWGKTKILMAQEKGKK